ncbi:MAG: HNH endonuclease signature motif containing protein [Prochlorothrix sp.]|nr:HNH endonuclease signature motif containing protein [Prochlorothrix sp.]
MTIDQVLRDVVRQRAGCACEFCGVHENDVGGKLTLDHFWPRSKGGGDALENLVYCCVRCNQHKQDYWPKTPDMPQLWNPRRETWDIHFLESAEGIWLPLTEIGQFTLNRLRLNRPALVSYRLKKQVQVEESRLLERYKQLAELLNQSNQQLVSLLLEQQILLREQRALLQLIARDRGEK